MHETHLIENIFRYLEDEEKDSCRRIKKVFVTISEFGGITEEHFREHYKAQSQGTRWESLDIEIKKIPYGKEFQITKIEFM
ncbi:MAG: hydrogenase/urease maturation nickel metallochaperone HypA [Candidatus Omnitrophica bacterium]|nr:hydrogenase/urease maturation nickel metallochaperone HypA [Candidatus Omnitrophota bacterium]